MPLTSNLSIIRAVTSVANAARQWQQRAAVQVTLRAGEHRGWGEAAPLPGVSKEQLDDVHAFLARFAWPSDPPLEVDAIARLTASIAAPSARFAVESALLGLAASIRRIPVWRLLASDAHPLALAHTLFSPAPDALRAAVQRARCDGVSVFKLKVGPDVALPDLLALRSLIGPQSELRLDANRTLPPGDLAKRLAAWSTLQPSFVEEPSSPEAIAELSGSPVALALDETLAEPSRDNLLRSPAVAFVVIKPARLGLLDGLALARRAGKTPIVSHLLDGEISRAAAAHLALALHGGAPGLGEHPALAGLSGRWRARWIQPAQISVPQEPGLGLTVME